MFYIRKDTLVTLNPVALPFKPECHEFSSQWAHWSFSFT